MNDREENERMSLVYALGRLDRQVLTNVLDDGQLVRRYGLAATRPLKLSETVTVDQDKLFEAFREASYGRDAKVIVTDDHISIECSLTLESNGDAVIHTAKRSFRFEDAALMSHDRSQRLMQLEAILRSNTLTQQAHQEAHAIASKESFAYDDFRTLVSLIGSSPEKFGDKVRDALRKGNLAESAFLPEDARHWNHLAAENRGSKSLADFINNELAAERNFRLAADPVRGFRSILLTFASPELVPREQLRTWQSETAVAAIEGTLDLRDHFSLVGAFEICADQVAKDTRLVALGDRLLELLIGDMERLLETSRVFAAVFTLAAARLALDHRTRDQPVYWRRLSAVAHAGLFVRSAGLPGNKNENLLKWAMAQKRDEYFLSIYREMSTEPRWSPEWIKPGILVADAFSRVYAAIKQMPTTNILESWDAKLNAAEEWIRTKGLINQAQLPAILQGARRDEPLPIFDEAFQAHVREIYERLAQEPSLENLLSALPLAEIYGPPPGMTSSILPAVQQLRSNETALRDLPTQAAVIGAAHLAVQANDVDLANAIADLYLTKALNNTAPPTIPEVVFRLVECSSADTDRVRARDRLLQNLEALAFSVSADRAAMLVQLLITLQQIDPDLAPFLGRAMHAARMGVPRVVVT